MNRKQIITIAREFGMSERHASPFGNPHFVHDQKGAELELIVSRGNLHVSHLFEAESMSHLNYDRDLPIEVWTADDVRGKLRQLSRRRDRLEDVAIAAAEMEAS